MCGIVGIVDFDSNVGHETITRMASTMNHRGPDGQGVFLGHGVALAANRLAIVGLDPSGLQPMSTVDSRFIIVFNGELFNYIEIRKLLTAEGVRFRTNTDTEVVLMAYIRWGESCIKRFNGMWGFAIWDSTSRTLFCSRDRLGEKPFYFSHRSGRFVFASEIKAICLDIGFRRSPNSSAIRDFLENERLDHSNETFFCGVNSLEAGSNLTFCESGASLRRYWEINPERVPPSNPLEAVRETLIDAVRLRIDTNVSTGYSLSGGVDSSSIVGIAKALRPNSRPITYTAVFPDAGLSERPYADAVVGRANAIPNWVGFDSREIVRNLKMVVRFHDEPFASLSMFAQWFVMKAAREGGRRIMIDGQGADELYAGYTTMFGRRFFDLLAEHRFAELNSEFRSCRKTMNLSSSSLLAFLCRAALPYSLDFRLRARLLKSNRLASNEIKDYCLLAERDFPTFPDTFRTTLSRMMFAHGVPELLRSLDRNSMAHSIEARAPFLDHRVVELAFSLPAACSISGGITKRILRKAMAPMLPNIVQSRTMKLSYETPHDRFFREGLGYVARDIFRSKSFLHRGWFDVTYCNRLLDSHLRGESQSGYQLWRVLNIELWAQEFMDYQSSA